MNWYKKAFTHQPLKPYLNMKDPDDKELVTEFNEEIEETYREGQQQQRWPNLKQIPPFFRNVKSFINAVRAAKPVALNEQQLMGVYNFSSVAETVERRMKEEQNISQKNEEWFDNMPTDDPNVSEGPLAKEREKAGGYTKGDSYRHKVGLVTGGQPITYPILINIGGNLCHVTGGTRQTAAVANGYVLPVKILQG